MRNRRAGYRKWKNFSACHFCFQCMNLKGAKEAFFLKKMWCCVVVREGERGRCNKVLSAELIM